MKTKDGKILVTRFGFGTVGDIVYVAADETTGTAPNLDPMRRRIGLTIASNGALYDSYFVETATGQLGSVAKLDLAGAEVDFITGLKKPVGVLASAWARERFGLRFGAGVHLESAEDRLGISGTTADDFLFYRPPTVSGPRHVVEAHLVAYAGPVKLTAEGALAKEGRSKDTDRNPETPRVAQDAVISRGGAVELAWMIFGPWRLQGSWPVQTQVQTWDWGALELAGRVERSGLGMPARDVTAGGATAASIAIRWWATSFAALLAATYFTAYDAPPIEEPDRSSAWLGIVRATARLPY